MDIQELFDRSCIAIFIPRREFYDDRSPEEDAARYLADIRLFINGTEFKDYYNFVLEVDGRGLPRLMINPISRFSGARPAGRRE